MSEKNKEILHKIAEENALQLKSFSVLTGGDINDVYLLQTETDTFVVKLNDAQEYPGMFEAEMNGLKHLAKPGVIDVPKPLATGQVGSQTYLLLEYKAAGKKKASFWQNFGNQLASLHQQTRETFGLDTNNYIGSLPQQNESIENAAQFYIEMRLKPQIKMAQDRGYDLGISNSFYRNCKDLIPKEKPSLIHGDLWSGNFLVNTEGDPCIIDPAVAFAPREMDLSLMKLFGGFHEDLFSSYQETFPLEKDWEHRIELYQLYYLLMHLNVFGTSYRPQVTSIIQKYS